VDSSISALQEVKNWLGIALIGLGFFALPFSLSNVYLLFGSIVSIFLGLCLALDE